jgi:hypothetical protein
MGGKEKRIEAVKDERGESIRARERETEKRVSSCARSPASSSILPLPLPAASPH